MEDYVLSVQATLSDQLGEEGLGRMIADDVRDCLKLDTIQAIREEASSNIPEIVRLMRSDPWNDERICSAGLKRLLYTAKHPYGLLSTMIESVVTEEGTELLLHSMNSHPNAADIQANASGIFHFVLGQHLQSPHCIEIEDEEFAEIAIALVNALRRHPNDGYVQEQAIVALATCAHHRDSLAALQSAVAPAGGIPLLFHALKNHSNRRPALLPDALYLLKSLCLVDPQSRRLMFHYARNHREETIEGIIEDDNITDNNVNLNAIIVRETLNDF